MKSKQPLYHEEEQLQISEFIKDPSTLKLLILAGTNIKSAELSTVGKCFNLIKLDLSSNMLSSIPISFNNFVQLKILYFHDNNIFEINVQNSTVEYVTLFNNPYKNYRQKVIAANQSLMALDYNIVTKKQRIGKLSPAAFTQLKWPIVEASSALENQEDYLNLLKAEIFVITNLHKRANNFEGIEQKLLGFKTFLKYQNKLHNLSDQMKIRKASVIEAVAQWKNYIAKKEKLRQFLAKRGKQDLLLNPFNYKKSQRRPAVNQVIDNFVTSLRQRLNARQILRPHIQSFIQFIPTSKKLTDIYRSASGGQLTKKLYFLKSQLHFLEKIFLYAKRLLFSRKEYDLCDNFQKLICRQKKEFFVFRLKDKNVQEKSFLKDSIRRTISLIAAEKNIDRRNFLYTKKGHKHIGLKSRLHLKLSPKEKDQLNKKMQQVSNKINQKYDSYDSLILYEVSNEKLFSKLMKIIRYFNSGNSNLILSNQTAYFQTEVVFEEQQKPKEKEKIFVGFDFFIKRTLAANLIQRFWRRIKEKRESPINIIRAIRQKRAKSIISHWLRELPFRQRMNMNKLYSYKKTIQKTTDVYIQLDIYMKMPHPMNLLKIDKYQPLANNSNEVLYHALHRDTYVQIIELSKRKWVRIVFPSIEKALQAHKMLLFATFKFYYNGFYLELFNYFEAQQPQHLEIYEKKVKHLFKIEISKSASQSSSFSISKKLPIQNPDAFFIWAQIGQKGVQTKYEMEKRSLPISIFVYNKHQKPLKVNCEINWLNPSSIYFYKKQVLKSTSFHGTIIRSRTPTRKPTSSNSKSKGDSFILENDFNKQYLTKIRSNQKRDRRNSEISPHNTVLLRNHRFKNRGGVTDNIQVDLLSQTLSIRRR